VILVLVGGDPKSEFQPDQIAGDIAGAKPGRPRIWALTKPMKHWELKGFGGTMAVELNFLNGLAQPKLGE
jgi:hypothetical protein